MHSTATRRLEVAIKARGIRTRELHELVMSEAKHMERLVKQHLQHTIDGTLIVAAALNRGRVNVQVADGWAPRDVLPTVD